MLKTRSIKTPAEADDGLRISVMSRHTLPDGVTPDLEITQQHYDWWLPGLFGPPPSLVGAYYREEITWNEFEKQYNQHLQRQPLQQSIELLGAYALESNVTLLCIEEKPLKCHRRLLAQACLVQMPELRLEVK